MGWIHFMSKIQKSAQILLTCDNTINRTSSRLRNGGCLVKIVLEIWEKRTGSGSTRF